MARVYMFNPLVSSRYGPSQSVIVNSDGAAPYNIKNTSAQIDYIPYSTSGARGVAWDKREAFLGRSGAAGSVSRTTTVNSENCLSTRPERPLPRGVNRFIFSPWPT